LEHVAAAVAGHHSLETEYRGHAFTGSCSTAKSSPR
jgi:hypothetical protein